MVGLLKVWGTPLYVGGSSHYVSGGCLPDLQGLGKVLVCLRYHVE